MKNKKLGRVEEKGLYMGLSRARNEKGQRVGMSVFAGWAENRKRRRKERTMENKMRVKFVW